MRITIGPVWSKVDDNLPTVKRILTFKYTSFRPGEFGGKHVEYEKCCMSKEGEFLTGLVPKLVKELAFKGITARYEVLSPAPQPVITELVSKKLYDYQVDAVSTALKKKRGVIVSSTGSGKTLIGIGIIKNFPHQNILWIAPTIDLLNQTYKRLLEEFEAPEIGIIGDGTFEPSRVTVGIVNSLYNSRLESSFLHGIGVTIVDECHRVSKLTGMYSKTLQQVPAAFRIGLTATLSKDPEALWSLEGNIGPVIKEVSTAHLTDIGKLAVPKVKIVRIPLDKRIKNIKRLHESWEDEEVQVGMEVRIVRKHKPGAYEEGIVRSSITNEAIADEIALHALNGNTCLVLTTLLEHGKNILEMIKRKYPQIKALYANGKTESEDREIVRMCLEKKQIDVAITTTIWKEGVDIPTLDVVINAAGSKSELFTLQVVGRGMRAAPGKDTFLIVDFFNPSSTYFIDHFGYRLSLFFEKGWM